MPLPTPTESTSYALVVHVTHKPGAKPKPQLIRSIMESALTIAARHPGIQDAAIADASENPRQPTIGTLPDRVTPPNQAPTVNTYTMLVTLVGRSPPDLEALTERIGIDLENGTDSGAPFDAAYVDAVEGDQLQKGPHGANMHIKALHAEARHDSTL